MNQAKVNMGWTRRLLYLLRAPMAVLLLTAGCTGGRSQPETSALPVWNMQRVGVVAATPIADNEHKALEDSARSAADTGVATATEFPKAGPLGLLMLPAVPILALTAAVTGSIGDAARADEIEAARTAIIQAQTDFFGSRTPSQSLSEALVAESRNFVGYYLTLLDDTVSSAAVGQATESALDTIAETIVTWRLDPDSDTSRKLWLEIRASLRLSATDGSGQLTTPDLVVRQGPFDFIEWAAEDASKLRDALRDMQAAMARHLFRRVFLDYPKPIPKVVRWDAIGFVPLTGVEDLALPYAGFGPIQPEYRITTRWAEGFGREQYWVETPTVESLTPLLAWESFPGTIQSDPYTTPRPFVDVYGREVERVAYDLQVYCQPRKGFLAWQIPPHVRYSRGSLTEPRHRIEQPLPANAQCVWRIRAGFRMDGRDRVTHWGTWYPFSTPH